MKRILLSLAAFAVAAPALVNAENLSREQFLDLAKKSGCLACHAIDHKVVGPAWQDVAKLYENDSTARAKLIDKVTHGGKGNWTSVTGGVPMPPYGARASQQDIEKMVDFILSLSKS